MPTPKNLDIKAQRLMRKKMTGCVLATDPAKHFEQLNTFLSALSANKIYYGRNNTLFINKKTAETEFNSKQLLLSFALHCADISNPVRPFDVCKKSAEAVLKEFFNQGDKEAEMGMPISFLCDRKKTSFAGSQLGFIQGIAMPSFKALNHLLPGIDKMIDFAREAETMWRAMKEEREIKK